MTLDEFKSWLIQNPHPLMGPKALFLLKDALSSLGVECLLVGAVTPSQIKKVPEPGQRRSSFSIRLSVGGQLWSTHGPMSHPEIALPHDQLHPSEQNYLRKYNKKCHISTSFTTESWQDWKIKFEKAVLESIPSNSTYKPSPRL